MRIKVLLRLLFLVILAVVKLLFGMDWVLITAAVVIVSDLDSIAEELEKRQKDKC